LPDNVDITIATEWEVRRIRLENWRIIYAINENWREIAVLTIKKRPPYDYDDLEFCKIGKNVISSETRNLVNELIL